MREIRCITFNEREAVTAVLDRRRAQRQAIPAGLIQGLTFKSTKGTASVLRVEDYDGNKTPIDISEAEMAAALVAYCLARKMPMPAKSNKGVQVIGGDITLILTIQEFNLLNVKKKITPDLGRRPSVS